MRLPLASATEWSTDVGYQASHLSHEQNFASLSACNFRHCLISHAALDVPNSVPHRNAGLEPTIYAVVAELVDALA